MKKDLRSSNSPKTNKANVHGIVESELVTLLLRGKDNFSIELHNDNIRYNIKPIEVLYKQNIVFVGSKNATINLSSMSLNIQP